MPVREEGVGLVTAPKMSTRAIDQVHAQTARQFQVHVQKNAAVYANQRTARGLSPEPRYILSDIGFADHPNRYSWSYMPPSDYAYQITPKGNDRPWSYIMLHCFGAGYDLRSALNKHRRLMQIEADEYGHNPTRWKAGIRELVTYKDYRKPNTRKVSIHFCISRRGNILVSCDLNDAAYHGGGDFSIKPGGNNKWTVGIELEAQMVRTAIGARPHFANYPKRQMIALAILCKKLETIRPIARTYISKQSGSVLSQIGSHPTGYITHKDVNSQKTDPGAQFDILSGNKGSGWDELWGYMDRMRGFNLATDVFKDPASAAELKQMTVLAQAIQEANSGQRAALTALWGKASAFRRAANMQAQSRQQRYKSSLGQATTLNAVIANAATAIEQLTQKLDLSSLQSIQGSIKSLNEETGLWETTS